MLALNSVLLAGKLAAKYQLRADLFKEKIDPADRDPNEALQASYLNLSIHSLSTLILLVGPMIPLKFFLLKKL